VGAWLNSGRLASSKRRLTPNISLQGLKPKIPSEWDVLESFGHQNVLQLAWTTRST